MANKKYRIKLSEEVRKELEALIAAGKAAAFRPPKAPSLPVFLPTLPPHPAGRLLPVCS